jgi:hypothetical protein
LFFFVLFLCSMLIVSLDCSFEQSRETINIRHKTRTKKN